MFRDPMPLSVPAELVINAVLRAERDAQAGDTEAKADAEALNHLLRTWDPSGVTRRAA